MPIFSNGTGPAWEVLNATGLRRNNFDGARAPGPSDDVSAGYERGSKWFHGGQWWVCRSNAPGAAVWENEGAAPPHGSYAEALAAPKPASLVRLSWVQGGREYAVVQQAGGPCLGGGWTPAGPVETGHFGHVGSGADESAQVQAALDWVESLGGGSIVLSAPLALGSTVLIPSRTTLRNPSLYETQPLPGCRTAYSNKVNDALTVPCQTPVLEDPVINGMGLADAWHGIMWVGAYNPRIIRPKISGFTARATASDGAGYLAADGGSPAYAGYDDATAIFLTTYRTSTGAMRRCGEWVIEHPEITGCANGIIGTTHPDDSGSDGANFGLLTYPNIDGVVTWGVAIRFGEQNVIMHGRVQSPNPVRALVHVGDTITTLINVGTDGIMFTSYVRLAEMTAGQSISQLRVAGNELLSAPVPFRSSLDATIDDLLAAVQASASPYTFARSAMRPALWIFAADGSKLPTGSTGITVTTDATKVIASGPSTSTANVTYRGAAVTTLTDANGFPEGHEGSDTIGILVTDQGGAEVINSGGNGPAHRIWFSGDISNLQEGGASAKARTNHFRASDGMTYLGGGVKSRARVETTTATGLSVAAVNPGDLSVAYTARAITRIPNGATDIVMINLDFTPTWTTASGALRFNLPPEVAPLVTSGNWLMLDVVQFKSNSLPASIIGGPKFRILSGGTYGEVIWLTSAGTVPAWSLSHLTSGVNAQLRVFGHLPINR